MPIIGQLGNNTNPNFQPANCVTLQANAPSSNAVGNKVGTLYFTKAGAAYLATKNTGLSGTVTWTLITSSTGAASAASYTATAGDFTATNGNLVLSTAGNKISIATGANASIGTSAAMTAGGITILTTAVTASSKIFVTHNTLAGTPGAVSAPTASIVAGTSFAIASSSNTDTSTVNWWIIN
jgi:hypothetical protein